MKLPPSKIPRGPRPRPTKEPADFATHPARAQNKWHQAAEEPAPVSSSSHRSASRAAKREAFTNIPQRQHRRVTSRSSELASDEDQNAVTLPKTPGASTSHARKRSIKPELLAQTFGKENTPSPPRRSSPNTSPARGGYIMQTQSQIQTPSRPRTFAGHLLLERDGMQVPPSPASSSELSPVAQDMMNNLRKQRMRARQVERRKGIWVRE
ncbi:hypothetical protein BV20DRAFT_946617 [Pilatotrama ljubarskyi]|nr:hypothetical protein BV20DRAFT_946617 [Pilatotrama ljubarskyi]